MVSIIAELGSNWYPLNPENSCSMLIRAAAEAGVDHVKMQDWSPIEQMNRTDEWKARCDPWTMTERLFRRCKTMCDRVGVGFLTSAFTEEAVVRGLRNDVLKIASSEAMNWDLLRAVRFHAEKQTVLVSLGETPDDQVERVMLTIGLNTGFDVVLMACVAEYPASKERAQKELQRMADLHRVYGLPVGWSSHVAYPDVVEVAWQVAKMGARWIEVHVRMEGTPEESPDNGPWSLYPDELGDLVSAVRDAE
jgi:sialic acid synthase SpsE